MTVSESERGLLDLPPELITGICLLVGPTVVRCRLVCRRLRDVIDASLELEYANELARDGMVDASARSPLAPARSVPEPYALPWTTTAERLARLRGLRAAWATLGWTRCVRVPMPGPCCAYELVGGFFCKTGPALGPGDDARAMSLTRLPGRGDARSTGEGRARTVGDLGPTRDFALDPAQDLVVLFRGTDVGSGVPTLELHLRTLSTNAAHPAARVPVLTRPRADVDQETEAETEVEAYPAAPTSVVVQIVEDVVGCMWCVDPGRPRVTVWNWKTGRAIADRSSARLPLGTWDFSFVCARALFVTCAEGCGSLELFTFTCPPAGEGDGDGLVHVASLRLPPIHPSVRVLSLGTHTGPFLAGCPPGASFVAADAPGGARVHVLAVHYAHLPTREGPRTRPRVGVVVHQRALERCLAQAAARPSVAPALEVPWGAWCADARVLPRVGLFQWLRYVHGERFAMLHPAPKAPGRSTLQVLDFNVRRASCDHERGDEDPAGRPKAHDDVEDPALGETTLERVDHPTRVLMPHIFVDVVESGLPYREARRDVRGEYSGMMIDDERLVGLKYPAFLNGDMGEIDVFTM